jgi:uncharacterized protein (TIGR02996 family)
MNATQRALLKAIAAAPHDDAPRLVYADWLDEHAAELPKKEREATAARAEIIRVQCELARLAEEDCDSRWVYEYLDSQGLYDLDSVYFRIDWSESDPGLARRLALRKREHELTSQYLDAWRENDCPVIKDVRFGFRRGFWTHVDLSAAKNVGRAVQALEKHPDLIPPSELHCDRELTPEDAKRLAGSPVFRYLVSASGDLQRPILYKALAQAKVAPGMRRVDVSCYFSDTLLPFARSDRWEGLRTLFALSHGDARITSLEPLAEAAHLASLQSLQLYFDAGCHPDTIEAVANGVWKNLRRLDFDAWIRDKSAMTLANGNAFKHLRYIHLGHEVGGRGATAVLSSAKLKELAVISLHGGQYGMHGLNATALKRASRPSLRVLSLPISGKADVLALANSPATRNVQLLNLRSPLSEPTVKAFFRAMRMPQLMMFSLGGDDIGPASVEAIASCDRLANLQALDLTRTKICNAGAKALAKSKHLGKLRYLNVSQASVPESGLAALRKRFGEDVVRA